MMIAPYLVSCVAVAEGLRAFTLTVRAESEEDARAQAELIVGRPSDPRRVADIEFLVQR